MEARKIIVDTLLTAVPDLLAVYLFGSRADGTAHAGSDYDIAMLLPPGDTIAGMLQFELAGQLAEKLESEVDLVDMRPSNVDFQFQILSQAERLFCADRSACDQFEMVCITQYQFLEEERKGILQSIKERGSVYG